MWHKPEILNRIANALFACAALLVLYAVAVRVTHLPMFAVRSIHVSGTPQHITRAQIETIASEHMRGTFLTLDLQSVRRAFEKLPWVREVELRRQWPDRLDVTIYEHAPLARWGSTALVNTQGEIFHAAYDGKLPVFLGPPDSAKEIAIQYDYFRRALSAVRAAPAVVQLTPRRAWQVRLENVTTIVLGREDLESRLARFLAVHGRTITPLNRRVEYIDLRYANGFAVRIPELKGEPGEPQKVAVTKRRTKRT